MIDISFTRERVQPTEDEDDHMNVIISQREAVGVETSDKEEDHDEPIKTSSIPTTSKYINIQPPKQEKESLALSVDGDEEIVIVRERVRWVDEEDDEVDAVEEVVVKVEKHMTNDGISGVKDSIWKQFFSRISWNRYGEDIAGETVAVNSDYDSWLTGYSDNTLIAKGAIGTVTLLIILTLCIKRLCISKKLSKYPKQQGNVDYAANNPTHNNNRFTLDDITDSLQQHVDTLRRLINISHDNALESLIECRKFVESVIQLVRDNDWVTSTVGTKSKLESLQTRMNHMKVQIELLSRQEEELIRNSTEDLIQKRSAYERQYELSRLMHSVEKFERELKVAETFDVFLIDEYQRELQRLLFIAQQQVDMELLEDLVPCCKVLQRFPSRPASVDPLIHQANEFVDNYFSEKRKEIDCYYEKERERELNFCKTLHNTFIEVGGVASITPLSVENNIEEQHFYHSDGHGSTSSLESLATITSTGNTSIDTAVNTLVRMQSNNNSMLLINQMKSSKTRIDENCREEHQKLTDKREKLLGRAARTANDKYSEHQSKQNAARGRRDELAAQTATTLHTLEDTKEARVKETSRAISLKENQLAGGQYLFFVIIAYWMAVLYFMKKTGCSISFTNNPVDDLKQCWWASVDLLCTICQHGNTSAPTVTSVVVDSTKTSIPVTIDLFTSQAMSGSAANILNTGNRMSSAFSFMSYWSSLSVMNANDIIMNGILDSVKGFFPTIDPISLHRYGCLLSIVWRALPGVTLGFVLSWTGLSWSGFPSFLSWITTLFCYSDVIYVLWRDIMRPILLIEAIHCVMHICFCFVDKVRWTMRSMFVCCILYFFIMTFIAYQLDDIVVFWVRKITCKL